MKINVLKAFLFPSSAPTGHRRSRSFSLFPLLLFTLASCRSAPEPSPALPGLDPGAPVERVAFGACADQRRPQPIWRTIAGAEPDLLLLLGDNVYASAPDRPDLAAEYARLDAVEGFASLRREVPILATWDDHDFAQNDGGASNPRRHEAERAFLDFWRVPASSPRRARPGIYDAHVLGPPGRRLQVILLDTRFFRGPLIRRPGGESPVHGRYVPNEDPEVTLLGEDQWRWLEAELRRPAELRLLVSSIQLVPDDHGWEKWGQLPHERRRLLRLLRESGAGGVVVLSGDRHLGEISRLPPDDPEGIGYGLVEVTTGGLTHGTGLPREPNRYRIVRRDFYREPNFGLLEVDWQGGTLRLEIRDLEGQPVLAHELGLADLKPAR